MPHAIITGGSSGIGLAVAHIYAARGYDLSLLARTEAALEAARAELMQIPGARAVEIASVDVSDGAATSAAVQHCEAVLGPCSILVTSAGIVDPGPFETLSPALFERQMAVNFFGSANAVRAVYAGMKQRGAGKIMLISSGAALIGIHDYAAYCASKSALYGFAEALRSEARVNGITVSICFPPDTETPQFARELGQRSPEAGIIMGRVAPWPVEEVATRIVQAVDRGRFELFFGLTLHALGRFGSTVKPFLAWYFDRAIRRLHGNRRT